MLTIRAIAEGQSRQIGPDELAEARSSEDGYVWIDLSEPDGDETEILTDPAVDLDPLTIEDMVDDHHLPKVDVHGDELTLTVHNLALDSIGTELTTRELDVALRKGLVVTHHEEAMAAVDAVAERLDRKGAVRMERPALLLFLLLDASMDVLVPFVDHLDQRLDIIEEDILTEPTEATRRDIYSLQRDVIHLRRAVVPQAETIRRLARDPIDLLDDHDRELFRDVYDHLYRAAELSDSYNQLLDSAMASYRSAMEDELNGMLTVLTIISALLLPITVLAGIYGMNFEVMPELTIPWAYPALWGVFVLIIASGLLWFRRRGWLGEEAERAADRRRRGLEQVLEVPVLGRVLKVPAAGARAVARAGRSRRRDG